VTNDRMTGSDWALVTESLDPLVPALLHPEWAARFPWLVQGTTTRGSHGTAFDLGLFAGASPAHLVHENWNRLLATTGMPCAAHARQVHEAEVRLHRSMPPGLSVVEPCDGHVTDAAGVLLAVTVADCVPIFVVSPEQRAVAALHAGWRGAAAGVLEAGLRVMDEALGASPGDLHVHLGPSICGECYEVGPEVFEALGRPSPGRPTAIDLRSVLAERAEAAGVGGDRITISSHCTRCTSSDLFSHRGGDGQRQVGYLGVRP
jgi:YfiH family protein